MLAESVVLSIFIGVFRGKKIKSLENLQIDKYWLILLSFSIEFASSLIIESDIQPLSQFITDNYFFVHMMVYILLFICFAFNRNNDKALVIVLIGVILNFIVIMANSGFMPVSTDMALSKGFNESIELLAKGRVAGHEVLIRGETKLWLLADIINIPPPYPFPQTISIGDIFISLGTFLFIQLGMRKNLSETIK